jgi:hypothetical protein
MQQAGALDCLTGLSSYGSTMANAQPPLQGLLPSFFTCDQLVRTDVRGIAVGIDTNEPRRACRDGVVQHRQFR